MNLKTIPEFVKYVIKKEKKNKKNKERKNI